MANLVVSDGKDRVISTSPGTFKLDLSNLEISDEKTKNVEIPESRRVATTPSALNAAADTDSSYNKIDFKHLANQKHADILAAKSRNIKDDEGSQKILKGHFTDFRIGKESSIKTLVPTRCEKRTRTISK